MYSEQTYKNTFFIVADFQNLQLNYKANHMNVWAASALSFSLLVSCDILTTSEIKLHSQPVIKKCLYCQWILSNDYFLFYNIIRISLVFQRLKPIFSFLVFPCFQCINLIFLWRQLLRHSAKMVSHCVKLNLVTVFCHLYFILGIVYKEI